MEYYGLDVHKLSISYTAMNAEGLIIRRGKVGPTPDAVRGIVAPSAGKARVALEATGAWSYVYDLLEPLCERVSMSRPRRVKAIASAKVKTDAVDATTLAHLLRTGLLPASYVPSPGVRTLRELLRTRQALVRMRTACYVRIHALLSKEGLLCPAADLFGRRGRQWLTAQHLSPVHALLLKLMLGTSDSLTQGVKDLEAELRRLLEEYPAMARLKEVPGFGFLTAAAFLAEVGAVERFPRARQLISYLGLAPRVYASGRYARLGKITKEGPPLVRSYLVQAVQGALRRPGPWQDLYLRVRERSGPQVARVAVARKLAIMAFHAIKHPKEVCAGVAPGNP